MTDQIQPRPGGEKFDPLWDCDDVARFLKQRVSTIRYWVHRSFIPHIKFPNSVRFDPPTVKAWVQGMTRVGAFDAARTISPPKETPSRVNPSPAVTNFPSDPPSASAAASASAAEISSRILSEHRTRIARKQRSRR